MKNLLITAASGVLLLISSQGMAANIEAGKKKHVEFAWKQNEDFKRGNYKISIYHNGFKIGEGVRELKKGGLFS